jgi:hypothetical protein
VLAIRVTARHTRFCVLCAIQLSGVGGEEGTSQSL